MKRLEINLNGWQRVWVVLSVIYLCIVVILSSNLFPTKKEIEKNWVYALIEDVNESSYSKFEIREVYNNMTDREIILKIQGKNRDDIKQKSKIMITNRIFQKEISLLKFKQLEYIGLGALIWILPMFALYLFGFSISWVIKGFKK